MKTIYRIRDRVLPAIRGHSKFAYQEFVPDDIDTSKIPYGRIFKRAEWGAAPATARYWKLSHPVLYVKTVFLALQSEDGKGLEEGLKGVEAVRMFQKLDMKNGMIDIRSNFIIDEDGLIYEGRGWYAQPGFDEDNPDHKKLNQQYLEICYIGDHHEAFLDHPIHTATAELLSLGKSCGIISDQAVLIGQSDSWDHFTDHFIDKYSLPHLKETESDNEQEINILDQ